MVSPAPAGRGAGGGGIYKKIYKRIKEGIDKSIYKSRGALTKRIKKQYSAKY